MAQRPGVPCVLVDVNYLNRIAMTDITDRKDIMELVDSFYSKVTNDDLLEPIFRHINWPKHIPTMYNFWSSMLLGDQTYQGNPFEKHIHLKIDSTHFNRWLELFTHNVDEHFAGARADEAKSRAVTIAGVFQHKLGLLS